jgi:Uma2 family endonuclease
MSTEIVDTALITGEELARIPDLPSCELISGVIVTMSPTGDDHGAYELNVGAEVRDYVKSKQLGKVRVGKVGMYVQRNPDTIRAADVVFISNERYAQKTKSTFLEIAPDLVAEIMSPNDSFSEVKQKLRDYFSIGVRLVWVLDPAAQLVYAYRSPDDVRTFGLADELPGDDVLPGFSVKVATLFEL